MLGAGNGAASFAGVLGPLIAGRSGSGTAHRSTAYAGDHSVNETVAELTRRCRRRPAVHPRRSKLKQSGIGAMFCTPRRRPLVLRYHGKLAPTTGACRTTRTRLNTEGWCEYIESGEIRSPRPTERKDSCMARILLRSLVQSSGGTDIGLYQVIVGRSITSFSPKRVRCGESFSR